MMTRPETTRRVRVVSGMPPGGSGAGRLMQAWRDVAAARGEFELHYAGPYAELARRTGRHAAGLAGLLALNHSRLVQRWQAQRLQALLAPWRDETVVFVHPFSLGLEALVRAVAARRCSWLYLLDSSFFCGRYYNALPTEHAPCVRCVGGQWSEMRRHRCGAGLMDQSLVIGHYGALLELVRDGRLRLLAQSETQAALARAHFGPQADVRVVGLWVKDFAELPAAAPAPEANPRWDVVFHARFDHAKGAQWALHLAQAMPELRFLFPFARSAVSRWKPANLLKAEGGAAAPTPANVTFSPLTWETGLREAVQAARVTLVPSLWSAPIEGALVKSIAWSERVAVLDAAYAFATELPDALVTRLPADVAAAAAKLRLSLAGPAPAAPARKAWLDEFVRYQQGFFARVLNAVNHPESSLHGTQ